MGRKLRIILGIFPSQEARDMLICRYNYPYWDLFVSLYFSQIYFSWSLFSVLFLVVFYALFKHTMHPKIPIADIA